MPLSIYKVEEFGKILHPLILKTLQKKNVSKAETCIHIVKALFDVA